MIASPPQVVVFRVNGVDRQLLVATPAEVRELGLTCWARATHRGKLNAGLYEVWDILDQRGARAVFDDRHLPKGFRPKNAFTVPGGDRHAGGLFWVAIPAAEVPAYLAAVRLLQETDHG